MRVLDLLAGPVEQEQHVPPEMDPLRLDGALDEALLVEALTKPASDRLLLVFDTRLALQMRGENLGAIVFAGLRGVSAAFRPVDQGLRAPVVLGWTAAATGPVHVSFGTLNGWEVEVRAVEGWFASGVIPELQGAQPDLVAEDWAAIASGFPSVESQFVLSRSSYRHEDDVRPPMDRR